MTSHDAAICLWRALNAGPGQVDLAGDCIDILQLMVTGYGALMASHHQALRAALLVGPSKGR
jgi:hypothetical protein